MKNSIHVSSALMAVCLGLLAFTAEAYAFSLQSIDRHEVSDANYCGDFNKLYTFQLSMNADEKAASKVTELLSESNLKVIEKELRADFIVPKQAKGLFVLESGKKALRTFVEADLEGREYCYQEDFSALFSFSKARENLTMLDPRDVAYFYVAFELPNSKQHSEPAFIVIDRKAEKLFIHQEW